MATYIQGVTDYIPQIQPFKPDLNFYSKVLQMKQDKYDAARREIGSLYGSLLYSPLTRQNNINRRDDFFKNIEHQIKKISGMDLSLAQNQEAAMKIFDPIINDDEMSHDWGYTKNIMTQMERGDNFRMCTDPKKCGGSYNPQSMTYLQLKLQEYAEADSKKALSMGTADAKFVPFNNIVMDALDWAKAQGLTVDEAIPMGGYIVKRQNGQKIKTPLLQLFLSTFGKDPKYRMHYDQMAYINKRNWIQENLEKNENDPYKTESAYYNEVINNTIKNLSADADDYDKVHTQVTTKSKAVKNRLSSQGIVANDKSSLKDLMETVEEETVSNEVQDYYKDLKSRISNLSVNKEDMSAFGKALESIVGDGLMKMDLALGVERFAETFNTVTDIKEDSFALRAQDHAYEIEEMKTKFQLDDQAAINSRIYDIGKETALKMLEGGLPSDQEGMLIEGAATKQGTVDMMAITEQGYSEGRKGVYQNHRKVNEYIITTLRNVAANQNLDSNTRQQAKDELSNMLGGFYDKTNNRFMKDGRIYDDYSEMVLDGKNEYQIYKNAQIVLERNTGQLGLLKGQVNNAMQLIQETEQLNLLRNGYGKILTDNNRIIRDAVSVLKMEDKNLDPVLFKGMFIDGSDGSVSVITSEEQYLERMKGVKFEGSPGPEKRKEILKKAYKKYYELYKKVYNSPADYNIKGIKPPTGFSITEGPDGALYAQGKMWTSNGLSPNSYGNRGFIDYMKDVERNKSYSKAVMGVRHSDYDTQESSTARLVFEQYKSSLLSGSFTTDESKQKAPRANVSYFDVDAGRGDIIGVSLTNINPQWLKSLATDDKKTMIGPTSIESISEKGITMYLSKDVANNLFRNNFKQKPGDIYINSGLTWTSSRPDGGTVSIKKVNDMIMVDGYLVGIDANGNRKNISLTNTFSGNMMSGAKLISTYTSLINDQQTQNMNFLENGGLPRVYDEQGLMQALQERMSPQGGQAMSTMNYFRQLIGK